jgi:hypothetical protein
MEKLCCTQDVCFLFFIHFLRNVFLSDLCSVIHAADASKGRM